ncbi:hypothetical protein LTS08_001590 [Lithohypha guttulata]|uniref:uncharacterized protein n=1 Tax=Lithohypha guttulata TaxID=1690604 RepID=UPI002DDE5F87|nr:hypothetical protein LTR51_003743 [Lithohypha guttulata]KAK5105313.1 hypothetical protein LTS08_001590 [Lithohypha guttulata]
MKPAKSCFHVLLLAAVAKAQSLLEAISTFPQLSNFTALMTDNPQLAGALLTSNSSSLTGQSTILVPDNSAFTKVSALYNVSMGNLSIQQLEPYLQYHLLAGLVTADNFTASEGVTVPTYLTGPTFNNRSAGAALGSSGADGDVRNGQVVFFQAKQTTSGSRKFVLRQLQNPTVNAQGGLGHQITRLEGGE